MRTAIIPARGGSRRIPRKNIRDFRGKPILAYSIETALTSGLFDHIMVSTEDEEIAQIVRARWPVSVRVHHRSPALARDEVGTQAVIADALRASPESDYACCLYATAPLILASDLWRGWVAVQKPDIWYAFSCGTNPLHDVGGFYWGKASAFRCNAPLFDEHTAMIPLPEERCCDINIPADWDRAEALYAAMKEKEMVSG